MCTDSGSLIRFPLPHWSPLLVPFHQSWIYMVGKKHSGKQTSQHQPVEAVNMSIQLFSVAISWGNKMNFSLYANMAGFCSNDHILLQFYMRTLKHIHNKLLFLHLKVSADIAILVLYISMYVRYTRRRVETITHKQQLATIGQLVFEDIPYSGKFSEILEKNNYFRKYIS